MRKEKIDKINELLSGMVRPLAVAFCKGYAWILHKSRNSEVKTIEEGKELLKMFPGLQRYDWPWIDDQDQKI